MTGDYSPCHSDAGLADETSFRPVRTSRWVRPSAAPRGARASRERVLCDRDGLGVNDSFRDDRTPPSGGSGAALQDRSRLAPARPTMARCALLASSREARVRVRTTRFRRCGLTTGSLSRLRSACRRLRLVRFREDDEVAIRVAQPQLAVTGIRVDVHVGNYIGASVAAPPDDGRSRRSQTTPRRRYRTGRRGR